MNTTFISIGIILVGFLICLFLIFRARRKAKAIIHYESIRDKLTLREEEEKEKAKEIVGEALGGFNLGSLIGGFVMILVAIGLYPEITKEINSVCSTTSANMTAAASTLFCSGSGLTILKIVPIFFALGILGIVISTVARGLKNVGVL